VNEIDPAGNDGDGVERRESCADDGLGDLIADEVSETPYEAASESMLDVAIEPTTAPRR